MRTGVFCQRIQARLVFTLPRPPTGIHQLHIKTTGYTPGLYTLTFVVGNVPTLYSLSFQVS